MSGALSGHVYLVCFEKQIGDAHHGPHAADPEQPGHPEDGR